MRWTRAATVLFSLAIVTSAAPRVASADDAAQARFHDDLARSAYAAGRYEQALREFFLEQRIAPNPRVAFNIALCFQQLRRHDDAFLAFTEYLEGGEDDAARREAAERAIRELSPRVARVRVETEPPGARIF